MQSIEIKWIAIRIAIVIHKIKFYKWAKELDQLLIFGFIHEFSMKLNSTLLSIRPFILSAIPESIQPFILLFTLQYLQYLHTHLHIHPTIHSTSHPNIHSTNHSSIHSPIHLHIHSNIYSASQPARKYKYFFMTFKE